MVAEIRRQIDSRVPPGAILNGLLLAGRSVDIKDIYNEKLKYKKEKLAGLTPTQALLKQRETYEGPEHEKYEYSFQLNGNRVSHLFFMHPDSIRMLQQHPNVILLDCTYKTNRFRMPMLHLTGVTSMNKNYELAYAFLPSEKDEDYLFVTEALKELCNRLHVRPRVFITDKV
jgi:hypothetical protein